MGRQLLVQLLARAQNGPKDTPKASEVSKSRETDLFDIEGAQDGSEDESESVVDEFMAFNPNKVDSVKHLGNIAAVDRLETANRQSFDLIAQLNERREYLKAKLAEEHALRADLNVLNEELKSRVKETSPATLRAQDPQVMIDKVRERKDEMDAQTVNLLRQLNKLISGPGTDTLMEQYAASASRKELATELRRTVETLLNEMFEPSSEGGYVKIDNANSPVLYFLLRGDLVTVHPHDNSLVRLREFGK
uniref:ARAD1A14256p n=1 Tax=Blastobotrys adeninivorans TaxID=409370 RepID=A0A060T3A9_BLAAD